MKNIKISLSAKNYADALTQVAQDNIVSYEEIIRDLEIINTIISKSADLSEVLLNPTISEDTKNSIIDEVFKNQINIKIIDFLKILIDKKRFNELDTIIEAFKKELDKKNNIKRVEITSAVELNESIKQKITDKLENKLQKKVIPNWQLNTEIIGGLVIKIEDDVIDTSLKNKLENLSKNISI